MKNIQNQNHVNHIPAMFEEFPDILNATDLQKALHIGRNTVYRLIDSGEIQTVRFGKIIRITKIALIDYVMGGQQ